MQVSVYLNSCHKRFLWTHKEVDLAPHPVVGLVLGDAEKFPQVLGFEGLGPFFSPRVSKQDPCFSAIEENGGDKRLAQVRRQLIVKQD